MSLRRSYITFIYIRSSYMNHFIYYTSELTSVVESLRRPLPLKYLKIVVMNMILIMFMNLMPLVGAKS